MASYVSWGRGRSALDAMIQGHEKVDYVKENRRKIKENTNMNHDKKLMMPARREKIVHVQNSAVVLVSA